MIIGKLYKPKGINKNGRKNVKQLWLDAIEIQINGGESDKTVLNYINKVSSSDNTPRKRKKFINYIKSTYRLNNNNLIEKIYNSINNKFVTLVNEQNKRIEDEKKIKSKEKICKKIDKSVNNNDNNNNSDSDSNRNSISTSTSTSNSDRESNSNSDHNGT